jgi:DNA invertase Pin-like site-specific DNA recombinase
MVGRDGVSFVSVTQQFKTTTSMGRLTLNVLLSFAQFEREVTSERIRDKIAASKRKGLWVGGTLPLGYHMKDDKIAVIEDEAERVRLIYRRPERPRPAATLCGERNFWMQRREAEIGLRDRSGHRRPQ